MDLYKVKNNQWFIYFAERIVEYHLDDTPLATKGLSTKDAKNINSELEQVRKSLNGLSEYARFLLNYQLGIELFGDPYHMITDSTYDDKDEFDIPDPVQDLLNGLEKVEAKRSMNERQQLGFDALCLLHQFDIKVDESRSGNFTRLLMVLIDASHLYIYSKKSSKTKYRFFNDHANKLARETLKRNS